MNKQSRHLTIRQIISHQRVSNQDELRRLLEAAGYETTQGTLSRDLKELGVARRHTPEGPRYTLPSESEDTRLAQLIGFEIESIEANESLIVIRTLPGRAAGVADIIDRFGLEDILGTVAGDNTIFVAPTSVSRLDSLSRDIRRIVAGDDGARDE